jgi:hypothetical protein
MPKVCTSRHACGAAAQAAEVDRVTRLKQDLITATAGLDRGLVSSVRHSPTTSTLGCTARCSTGARGQKLFCALVELDQAFTAKCCTFTASSSNCKLTNQGASHLCIAVTMPLQMRLR